MMPTADAIRAPNSGNLYARCAVVGNGGGLLQRQQGAEVKLFAWSIICPIPLLLITIRIAMQQYDDIDFVADHISYFASFTMFTESHEIPIRRYVICSFKLFDLIDRHAQRCKGF